MIPTMILAGLVVGRLWAIPLGGVAWAGVILIGGDCSWLCLPAFLLGAINTAVGVGAHLALRVPIRALLRRSLPRANEDDAK